MESAAALLKLFASCALDLVPYGVEDLKAKGLELSVASAIVQLIATMTKGGPSALLFVTSLLI